MIVTYQPDNLSHVQIKSEDAIPTHNEQHPNLASGTNFQVDRTTVNKNEIKSTSNSSLLFFVRRCRIIINSTHVPVVMNNVCRVAIPPVVSVTIGRINNSNEVMERAIRRTME